MPVRSTLRTSSQSFVLWILGREGWAAVLPRAPPGVPQDKIASRIEVLEILCLTVPPTPLPGSRVAPVACLARLACSPASCMAPPLRTARRRASLPGSRAGRRSLSRRQVRAGAQSVLRKMLSLGQESWAFGELAVTASDFEDILCEVRASFCGDDTSKGQDKYAPASPFWQSVRVMSGNMSGPRVFSSPTLQTGDQDGPQRGCLRSPPVLQGPVDAAGDRRAECKRVRKPPLMIDASRFAPGNTAAAEELAVGTEPSALGGCRYAVERRASVRKHRRCISRARSMTRSC